MEMYGFDAAVVPYDMCTVPEAMGLKISIYEDSADILYPTMSTKWFSPEEVNIPEDILERGRMPVVFEAIKRLKREVGEDHAIGSWVLGPFTMAGQLVELDILLKLTFKERKRVEKLLDELVELIIHIGKSYQDIGVDYINLREMGVGTDILSPMVFKSLIQPKLQKILDAWKLPKVLHICGSTDPIIEFMKECGADALSVDQKNTLVESRKKIGDEILLFGNFDPYYLLCKAAAHEVKNKIKECVDAGVDAVWPGCDIWPDVKDENMRAVAEAVMEYGRVPTPVVGRFCG
jgi:[methyl-Co(III) methanol-specific corrinoid protein]:coenzyme M methyltransferase